MNSDYCGCQKRLYHATGLSYIISIVIRLKFFTKENLPPSLQNESIEWWNEKETFWESYYMRPKRRPRGPWNYKFVTIFLSLSRWLRARIMQGLKITMARYGETCVLNRHRSPYSHQDNQYTRSRSRSKSRSPTQRRERSRSRERYFLSM